MNIPWHLFIEDRRCSLMTAFLSPFSVKLFVYYHYGTRNPGEGILLIYPRSSIDMETGLVDVFENGKRCHVQAYSPGDLEIL
jgi:hypothetical protein